MSDTGQVGDDPYRAGTLTVATVPPRIRKPSSVAFAVRVVGWAGLSAAILALPIGAVLAPAVAFSTVTFAMIAEWSWSVRWYWRALRVLRSMPFPIAHAAGGQPIEIKATGRSIEWIRVELAPAVEVTELELANIARTAQQAWPPLQIVVETAAKNRELVLTLHGWPHRDDDILVLVRLLATWGREVHATFKITRVTVSWRAIPPSDL